jgi:general secretion pathway protein E
MTIYSPKGCDDCGQSGYLHRTGIYELLKIDEPLRKMIHDGAAEGELRDYAIKHGLHSLRRDGLRWVQAGETSLEEIVRVTRE